MATTLTSSITQVDIARLKRALEALGDVRVVLITPPNGVIPTTVVLTKADKVSNLSVGQQADAQNVIDNHVDLLENSAQEISQLKAVIGTLQAGSIDFINDGLAWQIDANKNFVPVGIGRKIGRPDAPVSVIYASSIVGAGGGGGGGNAAVYNEIPIGMIDGLNSVFTTASNFVGSSTRVFYNGIRLELGPSKGYQETAPNQITLTFVPETGDQIMLDYDLDA